MNLRKSLLSLATIMALSTSVSADGTATYLPLSSGTTDSVWSLFGVNGFSDGEPSSLTGSSSGSFQAGFTEVEDTTPGDEAAESGLAAATGGGDMATLQSLDGTALLVGMDMTGTHFEVTESVRTMYVRIAGSTQNMKFDYKSSLEGKGIEILYGGVLYSVSAISQAYTWSNAATAATGGLSAAAGAGDRSTIAEVLDRTFSDNPASPTHFDKDVHLDTAAITRGDFYYYNATNSSWEVYNANAAANANDFTSFVVGKAYWGRTDRADIVQNGDGASGLILGTAPSGIPSSTLYEDANVSRLTDGWNMVSFSDTQPDIRHSATGIITSGWAAADDVTITDDSGLHSIQITFAGANDEQAWATLVNEGVEAAKLLGTLPTTFNVKAFAGEAAGTNGGSLVFISDKKFSLDATGAAAIPATTLAGGNPYITATNVQGAVVDIEALPVTSAYGEYSMIIDLMVSELAADDGVGTTDVAAELDSLALAGGGGGGTHFSAKMLFGTAGVDGTPFELAVAANANPTFANAQDQMELDAKFVTTAAGANGVGGINAIDIDNDGFLDKVILASTTKFYVKDATHVKILAADETLTAGGDVTVDGVVSLAMTIDATPTAAELVVLLEDDVDTADAGTGVYGAVGATAANLVLVSTVASTFDVKDLPHATNDFLSNATSDASLIADGAIGGAYNVGEIAALPVVQNHFLTSFATEAQPTVDTATLDIQINGNALIDELVINVNGTVIANTTASRKQYFDTIVKAINDARPAGDHYYATHDYDVATDDFTGTSILLAGVDVSVFTIVAGAVPDGGADIVPSVPADSNTATADTLGTSLPTIAADVKENPIYAPDFAIYGPLYTMNQAGYDVRGILKATTDMDSAGAGVASLAWDAIDITADEDDWFRDNEYNLFKINHNDGYWVYLETKAADSVVIGTPTLTSVAYSYYFANDASLTTTNMMTTASLSVDITGLDDADSADTASNAGSAYAVIGGEKVQLKRTSSTSNTFTANVSDMALASFAESTSPITVDIRAVDGKGESKESLTALSIDYVKPTTMAAVASGALSIALSADANTTSKFYVFEDYIPELSTARATALAAGTMTEVNATSDAATFNVCNNSTYSFGDVKALRIVAADGSIDAANLSNAVDFGYAVTLKGSHVLSHTQGDATRAQIGTTYTSTCEQNATQPALASDNNGVSLKSLVTGVNAKMAFDIDRTTDFDQDVAWTANYSLPTATTVAVVQIQSTSKYGGETFFVEYGGALYSGTFFSTQATADATTLTSTSAQSLTAVTASNVTLTP